MKIVLSILLGIIFILLVGTVKEQSVQAIDIKIMQDDGWELIGDKGGCKLWKKCTKTEKNLCTTVIWSTCMGDRATSVTMQ